MQRLAQNWLKRGLDSVRNRRPLLARRSRSVWVLLQDDPQPQYSAVHTSSRSPHVSHIPVDARRWLSADSAQQQQQQEASPERRSPLTRARSLSQLGLYQHFVLPHVETIQQLPEVSAALQQQPSSSTKDTVVNLKRAVEIFETMMGGKGSDYHKAVLAILAETHQASGQYEEALRIIDTILQYSDKKNEDSPVLLPVLLLLSKSMAHAQLGQFDQAARAAETVVESPMALSSDYLRASSQQLLHTSRLVMLDSNENDKEDLVDSKNDLSVSARALERVYKETTTANIGMLAAAALGNCGVAEIIYRDMMIRKSPSFSSHVPLDSALQYWRDGISVLERVAETSDIQQRSSQDHTYIHLIKSHLYCNMALTLLSKYDDDDDDNNEDRKDTLKTASEYASTALHLVEGEIDSAATSDYHHALGRALSLVAACYRRADSALTAEGLFQSAMDALQQSIGPQAQLDFRRTLDEYAILCRKWEKRGRDAENLERKSRDVDSSLPGGWKGKPDCYTGLFFFTPETFLS